MQYFKIALFLFLGVAFLPSDSVLHAQTGMGLFKRDTSMARRSSTDNPTGGTVMFLEKEIVQTLIDTQPNELTITLPDDGNGELTLILEKRSLFTESFRVVNNTTANAKHAELDLHYFGTVEDQPNSSVALSISEEEVAGLIQMPNRAIAIRSMRNYSGQEHVLYDYKNHPEQTELDCSSTDALPSYQPKKLTRSTETREPLCLAVRVEVDKSFVGNAPALMSQVAMLYQAIDINIQVSEIYYWTSASPYTGSTREIITKLQQGVANNGPLNGDLTILLTGQGNGGRAASVGLLCDPKAVCYSGQNDDVYTVAHELGHLLGAHHTHACKWNGNNTAIDGCGFNAGYGGCPGDDPAGGGTLMSYCHVRSVGINMNFHQQVGDLMYNFVKDHSDCTCGASGEEEEEIDFEDEVSANGGTDNIIGSICEMTINNPESCPISIYEMSNNQPTSLLLNIPANGNLKTPIKKNVSYGLYDNGILIQTFLATCGETLQVPSCGTAGPKVKGKLILEGFYDVYTKAMHQQLIEQKIVSTENPYQAFPWEYKGLTGLASIPSNAVDWILIMSRDVDGKVLDQSVGFLSSTGDLVDILGNIGIPLNQSTNNYISIHHRGHMAVMTSSPYQEGTVYDFTQREDMVMGNNQVKSIGNRYALLAGDFDANGVINNQDYNQWVSKSSRINEYIAADVDGNGIINNKDYNLWIANRSKIGYMPLHY